MSEEFSPDLITVIDEEGTEHQFELIDSIETDDGRYVALLPMVEESEDQLDSSGELIILEVLEEEGEDTLSPIESDEMFDNIAAIFEERLSDLFEVEEVEVDEAESE